MQQWGMVLGNPSSSNTFPVYIGIFNPQASSLLKTQSSFYTKDSFEQDIIVQFDTQTSSELSV